MTPEEKAEMIAEVKPQIMEIMSKQADKLISELLPAIIGAHNGGVDACIHLVDVLLEQDYLRPEERRTISLLRDAMAKAKE